MKRAGADMIGTCLDLNGMKTLTQELERQGMGDIPLYHPNTYDQKFVAAAGDLFEGDYIGVAFRPFEADASGSALADYFKWMNETSAEPTEAAMNDWIDADLAYQGILAAGPSFDRAKVIAATNVMTEYSADGLINPIDWSRQHESPTQDDPATHGYKQECFAMVQVRNGKFKVVGGTKKDLFFCWPNNDRSRSEPRPTKHQLRPTRPIVTSTGRIRNTVDGGTPGNRDPRAAASCISSAELADASAIRRAPTLDHK